MRPGASTTVGNPLLRVQMRPDTNPHVARWAFARVERWATTLLVGLGMMLLGLPEDLADTNGWVAPVVFGLGMALLFELCRRFHLLPMTALLLLVAGAYALGIGDASLRGVSQYGIYASTDSVAQALFNVWLFLAILILGGAGFDRLFTRLIPRLRGVATEDPLRGIISTGITLLVTVSFVFAVATGTWTFYGTQGASTDLTGTFRWEFLCEPAALGALAVVVDNMLRAAEKGASRKRMVLLGVLATLLTIILFTRQIRRIMLMAMITSFLQIAWNPVGAVRWFGSLRRVVVLAAIFGAFTLSLHYGSVAWRESAAQFRTNDLSKRMEDAVTRVGDIDDQEVLRHTRTRLNYLWLESASVEYQPALGRFLTLPEMFIRTLYFYLPGAIVPVKYQYEFQSCETAFTDMRLNADLPCTPSAEGYIAGRSLGVVAVALAWAPIIGLGCLLMRRRSALGLIIAMHLFDPMCIVETSAFPIIAAVRVALIGVGCLAVCCVLGVLFFGWGVLGPNRQKRLGIARA